MKYNLRQIISNSMFEDMYYQKMYLQHIINLAFFNTYKLKISSESGSYAFVYILYKV